MPLYELRDGTLRAFHRLRPGPDFYEHELESLVWNDLESFTGESLFPLARQARIGPGGIPDVLALDESGRIVVIEVKRDIDRGQLAQCLEYAGWARLTNLDEISGLYNRDPAHQGKEAFFRDWQDFTETTTPVTINPQPRLYLIARDVDGRTRSALEFLQASSLPVTVIPVTMYEDPSGRRLVDIDADHEPAAPVAGATGTIPVPVTANGRRVVVRDLLDAGFIVADEPVEFVRPRVGEQFDAVVLTDGTFRLPDGTIHQSPSGAAMHAADLPSYDGWHAWRVPRLGGTTLHSLRLRYVTENDGSGGGETPSTGPGEGPPGPDTA